MPSASTPQFTPPPVVECISREHCLGLGKKVHSPNKICAECLQRYDLQQLQIWANGNVEAQAKMDEELSRKQMVKRNIEARGRYLCAFEDPDYHHCRWRRMELNLRSTRLTCSMVRRKGTACQRCWQHHLLRIGIVQYFNPMGMCHEEVDRAVPQRRSSEASDEDDDVDIEGYNVILS